MKTIQEQAVIAATWHRNLAWERADMMMQVAASFPEPTSRPSYIQARHEWRTGDLFYLQAMRLRNGVNEGHSAEQA